MNAISLGALNNFADSPTKSINLFSIDLSLASKVRIEFLAFDFVSTSRAASAASPRRLFQLAAGNFIFPL